jgi:hypothetical protein
MESYHGLRIAAHSVAERAVNFALISGGSFEHKSLLTFLASPFFNTKVLWYNVLCYFFHPKIMDFPLYRKNPNQLNLDIKP